MILSKKYKDPTDEHNFALGKVYKRKIATNIFKIIFYLTTTIGGYSILSQLDYFPTQLGGSGYMSKMFEPGFPDAFYHWKPQYFDFYYLSCLSYCLSDLVWLLFIYEMQTDFILMLLHHICTISLISFSYFTNYSNIGCIVLFLHDIGDIFVYVARCVINIDIKSWIKSVVGVVLLIVFIYTRIYVFADLILVIYNYAPDWTSITKCLWGFLTFLYIMHINWVYLILKRIFAALFENHFEDTAKVNKFSKTH
jgi:hypothetical protein